MKLPRDLPGVDLARLLARYGYEIRRQTGSHMRLTSLTMGRAHHLTIPAHRCMAVGTLSHIVSDVAVYLEREREELALEMFSG
jgi:predicted RNA binding protein YcfA (HicA-like mRNA interferase family)